MSHRRRCSNHPLLVSDTRSQDVGIDLLFAWSTLLPVALRVLALHFLITSTLVGFAASLVRLWATSLLFPIVPRRLSFCVFRLLLSVRFVRYALLSHHCSLQNDNLPRSLTALPARFSATWLPAAFSSTSAASLFAAALLTSSAAGVRLSALTTTAAVAGLFLLFLSDHRSSLMSAKGGNCGASGELEY